MGKFKESLNENTYKVGDEVEYVGEGFIGFDKKDTKMKVLDIESRVVRVEYKGEKLLVRKYEIKTI